MLYVAMYYVQHICMYTVYVPNYVQSILVIINKILLDYNSTNYNIIHIININYSNTTLANTAITSRL